MMEDPNMSEGQANTDRDRYAETPSKIVSGAGQSSDAALDGVDQATEKATSLLGQAKDKALSAAAEQKDGLADRLDGLAQSVHKSGEQFAGQQDWIASAIERGASELGALATSLRDNDLASLTHQIKSLAARQPAVFVGACLAGGFALARVGKIVAADVSRSDLPTMPEVGHGNT